jgi:putative transposase
MLVKAPGSAGPGFDAVEFEWQAGCGAFTVSYSQVEVVRKYIRNQAGHHRKQSFREEFQTMLLRHEIQFDERRLFEDEFDG